MVDCPLTGFDCVTCEAGDCSLERKLDELGRAHVPESVVALVRAATRLRDQIAEWNDGGPAASAAESKALFEALDLALQPFGSDGGEAVLAGFAKRMRSEGVRMGSGVITAGMTVTQIERALLALAVAVGGET